MNREYKDADELRSIVDLSFVDAYRSFDSSITPDLLDYISMCVSRKLIEECNRAKLRVRAADMSAVPDRTRVQEFSVKEYAARAVLNLQDDVVRVISTLFAGDFLNQSSPTKCRVALSNHLKSKLGWSRRRLENVYEEIRNINA